MPNFLRGLFETKGAPKNAIPRAVANPRGGYYNGAIPNMQSWDIEQAIQKGYERVIWVYRCIDACASNGSSVPIVLREYDSSDGKVVESPQITKLLNRRANIYETAQQFRYRLITQLLLSRRGAFVEVVRDRMGEPKELHLLPPGSTTPIPDSNKFVSGYRVQTVSQGLVELEPERVIWIRVKPHPTDVYAQMTPLVAAGLAADTDFLARLYNRNFLLNDGRPGMLIAVQGQLGDEDAEELKRRFSGGASSAGQTSVIEADGLQVQDMGSSPRDVQWQEAVRGSKEDILLAFGTPESVLGNASGRTFDNADAEFEIFWTVTMKPLLEAIGSGFDILTEGGLEDDIYAAHDYSKVDVLQRQERARHEKALAEFQAGTLTIDEYLEAVGRMPFKQPGTEVLWIPQGLVPVGKDEKTTQAAQGLMPVGAGQPANPAEEARNGALMGVQQGWRELDSQNAARALRLAGKQNPPLAGRGETKSLRKTIEFKRLEHPYGAERNALEAEIGAYINAWSKRQERTVIERLGGTKARKHTRHWEGQPGTKALDAIYVVNPQQWADDLAESMADLFEAIAEKEALKAALELNKAGVVQKIVDDGNGFPGGKTPLDKLVGGSGLGRLAVIERPVAAVEDMIRDAALRQSQRVADRINELDRQGLSLEDIKKEVRGMIGSRSSWKRGLATAAATSVMEGARNEVFAQGGKYVKRIWRTMHDERVRPTHRKAFGQKRSATKPFLVGGHHLMYPGDLTGPIEETANCFPADTLVDGQINGAYKRWYSGPMIEVITADGKHLTGTPNHPVLTDQGWVPLQFIVVGDYAISHQRDIQATVGHDVDRHPAQIGEVYDSLAMTFDPMRVSGSRMNFHGEIPDSDVNVVLANGQLRNEVNTPADEFVHQLLLPATDPNGHALFGMGTLDQFRMGSLTATKSIVGSRSQRTALLTGHPRHSGTHGSRPITRLHALVDQEGSHGVPPDPGFVSKGLLGLSGEVFLDEVVGVRRIECWSGHVYNLSTVTGAYTSNGIIVHNCRCWVEVVTTI